MLSCRCRADIYPETQYNAISSTPDAPLSMTALVSVEISLYEAVYAKNWLKERLKALIESQVLLATFAAVLGSKRPENTYHSDVNGFDILSLVFTTIYLWQTVLVWIGRTSFDIGRAVKIFNILALLFILAVSGWRYEDVLRSPTV